MRFVFILFLFFSCSLQATDCPFDVGSAVIERQQVYETDHWRVLVDYKPVMPGHLLLVSKRHIPDRHHLTLEEHIDLYGVEQCVYEVLQLRYGEDTHNFQYEKNGYKAGQSVRDHFHIHLFPMTKRLAWWEQTLFLMKLMILPPSKLSKEELEMEVYELQSYFTIANCPISQAK